MVNVTPIDNLDDPRISIYHSLKGKRIEEDGLFIAEGDKVLRALLHSDLEIVSALMTEEWLLRLSRPLSKKAQKYIHIFIMKQDKMEGVVGFKLHQGLMVAARIPSGLSLAEASASWRSPHLVLAFDGIKDAENIGLIVRNSVAFGVDAIIVDGRSSNPYLRRAVRVSMGTVFKMPVVQVDRLSITLKELKEKFRTRIIAASPAAGSESLNEIDLSGNICLVFGSEVHGLSENVVMLADSVARIPISEDLDSINVSCASAVFLYHVASKRPFNRTKTAKNTGRRNSRVL